jgi:hypothetical protein
MERAVFAARLRGSRVFSSPEGGVIDSFTYPQQQADQSMAREPDGTGE